MPHIPSTARGARFIGWGTSLGHRVVTNDDLTASMDTNDEWIRERTGIHRRHVGGSTAELSTISGKAALDMAGIDPKSIDALILATTTPDRTVPATSATIQNALGLACGAFDVNAACSGFVYGLVVAHGLIGVGAERIMIIGTDTLSRIVDWTDRNTAPCSLTVLEQQLLKAPKVTASYLAGILMLTEALKRSCMPRLVPPFR